MLNQFLSGTIFMASMVVAMYFAKFWTKTRDALFLYFSIAFALMAVERLLLLAIAETNIEFSPLVYGTRLIAFLLIIVAIGNKNRAAR